MLHVGDIMSTVGGVEYHGGTQITKNCIPMVLNTPIYYDIPTVLNIPHGTQDIPQQYS